MKKVGKEMMGRRWLSNRSGKVLRVDNMNQNLRKMEYAVRGRVPTAAGELAKEMASGKVKKDFKEILYCNIGNPQSVGQKPITYYRNMLALIDAPHLLENKDVGKVFPSDCIEKAKEILKNLPNGTGAYSHSQGVEYFRQTVAKFIQKRDGYASDPENIFLTDGASTAINYILTTLIANENDGVLIPIPQYPIYSALIRLLGGTQVDYFLDEDNGWAIDMESLKKSLKAAKDRGINTKAMVIINPGNPTGNVLPKEQIKELISLCKKEKLILLADEVYQENIYFKDKPFYSVKKAVRDLGPGYDEFEYVSFHSTSKGIIGECGRRGGYMEICNFEKEVKEEILKMASSGLCSNLDGQVMTHLMLSPPSTNEASYESFQRETKETFEALKRKSRMLHESLNKVDGISCQPLEGAMYAFPKISIPEKAIVEAKKKNMDVDTLYCLSLLQETGICCVPGSGFGQREGSHHFRMTFLPEEEKLKEAMDGLQDHHASFVKNYR